MTPEDAADRTVASGHDFMAYREALVGYFRRRIGNSVEIDDLVQEVFLRLSARGSDERIEFLRGYVFQVASSVLIDQQRRKTVRHADDHVEFDPDTVVVEHDIGPARILEGREALRIALAALAALPERTRTIFVLRRMEGMRYRDIADRLGISVSAAEKHMTRAIEHLIAAGRAT